MRASFHHTSSSHHYPSSRMQGSTPPCSFPQMSPSRRKKEIRETLTIGWQSGRRCRGSWAGKRTFCEMSAHTPIQKLSQAAAGGKLFSGASPLPAVHSPKSQNLPPSRSYSSNVLGAVGALEFRSAEGSLIRSQKVSSCFLPAAFLSMSASPQLRSKLPPS